MASRVPGFVKAGERQFNNYLTFRRFDFIHSQTLYWSRAFLKTLGVISQGQ